MREAARGYQRNTEDNTPEGLFESFLRDYGPRRETLKTGNVSGSILR